MVIIFVTLTLILLTNWLFSQVFLFIPIHLLNYLDSLSAWVVIGIMALILAWCLGD